MASAGHDPAVLQHQNAVRIPHGGHALRDDHQGGPGEVPAQRRPQPGGCLIVQGAVGVVQHQDLRPAGQRPGDQQPLPLAAGEVGAPQLQRGVQPLGEAGDELPGLGGVHGGLYILPGEIPQKGDVLINGPGDKALALKGDAEPVLHGPGRLVPDVLPAHPDDAAVCVVEPQEQGDQSGLAAAGGTQNAQRLPFLQGEAHIRQVRLYPVVGEGGPLHPQEFRPARICAGEGLGRRFFQDLADPAGGGHALADPDKDLGDAQCGALD